MATGLSNAAIASTLFMSERAVEKHIGVGLPEARPGQRVRRQPAGDGGARVPRRHRRHAAGLRRASHPGRAASPLPRWLVAGGQSWRGGVRRRRRGPRPGRRRPGAVPPAMAAVVEETDGFVVVGSATTGEESLTAAAALRPDLVLMDVNLPGIDGIEATRRLTSAADGPVVVLLSTYDAGPVRHRRLRSDGVRRQGGVRPGPAVEPGGPPPAPTRPPDAAGMRTVTAPSAAVTRAADRAPPGRSTALQVQPVAGHAGRSAARSSSPVGRQLDRGARSETRAPPRRSRSRPPPPPAREPPPRRRRVDASVAAEPAPARQRAERRAPARPWRAGSGRRPGSARAAPRARVGVHQLLERAGLPTRGRLRGAQPVRQPSSGGQHLAGDRRLQRPADRVVGLDDAGPGLGQLLRGAIQGGDPVGELGLHRRVAQRDRRLVGERLEQARVRSAHLASAAGRDRDAAPGRRRRCARDVVRLPGRSAGLAPGRRHDAAAGQRRGSPSRPGPTPRGRPPPRRRAAGRRAAASRRAGG